MSDSHMQPHDQFFKLIFSDPQKARDLLQGYLPPDIQKGIDLETLTPDTQSYVDEELHEHIADLVFNCFTLETKEPLKIAFLLEHKSFKPKYIHFQLLRYMLNMWERQTRQKEKPVPVIPVVIYHGTSRWQPGPMQGYFSNTFPEWMKAILPEFGFSLVNLKRIRVEDIEAKFQDWEIRKSLLVMKFILSRDLKSNLNLILKVSNFPEDQEQAARFFRTLIDYLVVGSKLKETVIMEAVNDNLLEWGYVPGSVAEKYHKKGILEGREEGREEGLEIGRESTLRQSVRHMQTLGQTPDQIARLLNLPLDQVLLFLGQ